MKEVYIVAAVRTPIGSFGGTLAGLSATQLGSLAVKAAMSKINLDAKQVQELFFGN
ncbi:MAG: acetyl-CoA C-acetyltransferase, partial [Cyclobacteriaceae bacterium]|nr:acetyl-CoA C-acetyltransferase [Cyclobacteriaceae bacterium]